MKLSKPAKLARVPGVADARIETRHIIMKVNELHAMVNSAKPELHTNPVGQRSATSAVFGNKKNKRIIECIMDGTGIGLMIFRDITKCDEEEIKRLYPTFKALVIDGGHRTRAIKHYIGNKFAVKINGVNKKFRDLSDAERTVFLDASIIVEYKICTSLQAIEIFRSVNSTTQVNAYEMIMANDQSEVCKFVRMLCKSYPEYKDNEIHPIFQTSYNSDEIEVTERFKTINERAIWHTYIFIALHKAIANGNVDAGEKESRLLIENEAAGKSCLGSKVKKTVNRFFNDLLNFQKTYKTKINIDVFGAFQGVWFELLCQHKAFSINMEDFVPAFREARALLVAKNNTNSVYQDRIIDNVLGEKVNIKELVRRDVTAFSKGKLQSHVAKIILEELGNIGDAGITVLESQRSYRRRDRQVVLDLQKGRCHMCKKPVTIDECELAHDTPYSKGGKVKDGVAMCRKCHSGQGTLTLKEYSFMKEFASLVSARKPKTPGLHIR